LQWKVYVPPPRFEIGTDTGTSFAIGRVTSKSGLPFGPTASEVIVCTKSELLVTVSVPPLAIVRWLGEKASVRPSIVIAPDVGRSVLVTERSAEASSVAPFWAWPFSTTAAPASASATTVADRRAAARLPL